MKALIVCVIMLLFAKWVYAQRQITPEDIRRFKKKHPKANVEELLRFRQREKRKWKRAHQEALEKAK